MMILMNRTCNILLIFFTCFELIYPQNISDVKAIDGLSKPLKEYDNGIGLSYFCSQAGDVKAFYKIHHEFHETFLKAAGNSKLYDLIIQLGMKFSRLRMASLSVHGRMAISVAEHDKLLDAFRNRDGKAAEALVKKTAAIGGKVLLESMAHSKGEPTQAALLRENIDAF